MSTTPFSLLSVIHHSDDFSYLEKSVASVYASELLPTEWVIVCNGDLPAHYTALIAAQNNSINIKIIKTQETGFANALNKGLSSATYDIIARIDSDDKVYPARFATQMAYMNTHNDIDVLGSAICVIDNNDEVINTRYLPLTHNQICARLWTCPFAHPSVMYRKQRVLDVGGYSEEWHRAEDFHLWLKLYRAGAKFANLESALTYYRQTPDSFRKNSLKANWARIGIALKANRATGGSIFVALFCLASLGRVFLPYRVNYILYNLLNNRIRNG